MMSPALKALLDRLPPAEELDFDRFQAALLHIRYSGSVTYDYLNGVPQQINLGPPVKLTICRGGNGGLDKGRGPKAG